MILARRNLSTSLRCRGALRPMDRYDRLPPELRRWVSTAALPWSANSVLRLWSRLHRETGGDSGDMIRRMDLAEQRMLRREWRRVWGKDYSDQAASTIASPSRCRA